MYICWSNLTQYCYSHFIMRKYFLLFFLTLLLPLFSISGHPSKSNHDEPFLRVQQGNIDHYSTWADSVFNSLTLEQRIAQLLMIRVHTDRDEKYYSDIIRLVKEFNIGGVAFFRGGPQRQVSMTNRLQSQVQTPLLVAMDAEWGPSMRLDSTIVFPKQMALGAITDETLIYQMGLEVGRQLNRLGVHMNFAPVVDVNNNADNPVINFRAFGEDREAVAKRGLAYMHGMQDAGILACAKHFPGHGDTDADSHHTLPLLKQRYEELDSIHLFPFRELVSQGLHAVMVAHLEIPAMEAEEQLASTLSRNIVTNILKKDLGFQGLVVTDALDMRGVSDFFNPGELELRALMAGNDILLLPENVPAAISTIKNAVNNGLIEEALINHSVRKILYYKEMVGLDHVDFISPKNLIKDLNTVNAKMLNKQLAEAALTLVKNDRNLIPIGPINNQRIAALSIGAAKDNTFHSMLSKYTSVDLFGIDKNHSPQRRNQVLAELEDYDLVLISVQNNSTLASRDYGIHQETVSLVNAIARRQRMALTIFANPYSLALFGEDISHAAAVMVAYEDTEIFKSSAAQALFGGIQIKGRLPVSASPMFPADLGIITPMPGRLRFGEPEEAGVRSEDLNRIDSIATEGIRMRAYPGCQIVVAKDGMVIYHKVFGYHTYDSLTPVTRDDIYDLASITKIAGATSAVMKLVDEGRLDIDMPLVAYLPWLRGSDKEQMTLREILSHQARLTPWIPFYLSTMDNGIYLDDVYQHEKSPYYSMQVSDQLYINNSYRDTIFTNIAASPLLRNNSYRYSDLGFILLPEIIERITGQTIDQFVDHFLFQPLGLSTMGYLPLQRFDIARITPSEHDTIWRKQVIHGHVNDPAAAMLGGISGHAGLFSNASDLAVVMQLFLNKGSYGGHHFFQERTVNDFTHIQFRENNNRRGLGFDKPSTDPEQNGPTAKSASPVSFGHTGFTGTYAWADPAENLVYVFLSNRTFPDQNNRLLAAESIRTNIQQVIYDAIYHTRLLEFFTSQNSRQQPIYHPHHYVNLSPLLLPYIPQDQTLPMHDHGFDGSRDKPGQSLQ